MYESDPNSYVNAEHAWFDPKDAEYIRIFKTIGHAKNGLCQRKLEIETRSLYT